MWCVCNASIAQKGYQNKHLSNNFKARIHHLSIIYLTTLMHLFIVQESQSNSKGNRETGMGKVI